MNNEKIYFTPKIKELRKSRHLIQDELAKKINMARGVLAYYEFSTRNPNLDTIKKFADFFNVSAIELIEEQQNRKTGHITKFDKLIDKVKAFSSAKQRMIYNILQASIELK